MFESLKNFLSTQYNIVKSIITLAHLEAKLARASFARLVMALCIIAVLGLTTWVTILILLGYLIVWITHQFLLAILGTLIVNSLLLGIFIRYAYVNVQNMRFEKTRKFLHQQMKPYDAQTIKKTNHENRIPTTAL